MSKSIMCPACSHEFPLTESLAGPLLRKMQLEAAARQDAALAAQKRAIETAASEGAVRAQAARLAEIEEAAAAREAELVALKARDRARDVKLAEAQAAQARALAAEATLDERAREMDLTIQKRVMAGTEAARARLAVEAEVLAAERLTSVEEKAALKLAEKDTQMDGLRRQIEILQRKMEQGSQQRQGEAAEVVLEDQLARAFPTDTLEPVPKGIRGGDCLLRVGEAGLILWESKRAANWSRDWLPKLRDDARTAGADLAVLVSEVRPEGVETFAQIDGVWVVAPRFAIPLAAVLREGLASISLARGQRQGQATKTEMLYDYLMGPQFRARIEAVAERMDELRSGLLQEQKLMQRLWAAREKQIGTAQAAMIGFYGDIQGIGGASMQQIAALEPHFVEEHDDG